MNITLMTVEGDLCELTVEPRGTTHDGHPLLRIDGDLYALIEVDQ